jgi:purine-binding chemotaxis protein CheW
MGDSIASSETFMAAVFETGGGTFAIGSSRIEEIARVPAITPVRGAGKAVLGIANLRGRIITVLDAAAILGFGRGAAGEGARILVADGGGESIGLLVEGLRDVVEVERSTLRVFSGGSGEDRFLGAFESQGRTAVLLDPDKVLAAG